MKHSKYYNNNNNNNNNSDGGGGGDNNNKMQMDRMVFERTFCVETLVHVIKQNNGNRKM
jgi:meiotically up-regulated gene 157 (Mug157) protein